MTLIIGLVVILAMTAGGFILSGGKFDIILHALPFELMIIGGSAIGAFVVANSIPVIKQSLAGVGKVMKGAKWKSTDYVDLLMLMFEFTKVYKEKGLVELDSHIERPQESSIFSKYPRILADHHAIAMISDTFRMVSMGVDDEHQIEDHLQKMIKKHHHEALAPAKALQVMADGLPALGIVAAVLGVIKTMASIDKPPAILGAMIGGALVGTFLGVFLAYCIVAPISSRLKQVEEDDGAFYDVIKNIIVSTIKGDAPAIAVEFGRNSVPSKLQPNFYEIEQAQKAAKSG